MVPLIQRPPAPTTTPPAPLPWRKRPLWNRFTPLQLLVMVLASIAPAIIAGTIGAELLGLISTEEMIDVALGAGENPGMIIFGAMFLASPVQWMTGRSQVRVRKFLGIVFFLLAVSNGAMFVVESRVADEIGRPLVIAGLLALTVALPLFLTSSRRAQRLLGMGRWRQLHKLTYVVAFALLAHVALVGDIGPGALLITLGFIARIPAIRRRLERRAASNAA